MNSILSKAELKKLPRPIRAKPIITPKSEPINPIIKLSVSHILNMFDGGIPSDLSIAISPLRLMIEASIDCSIKKVPTINAKHERIVRFNLKAELISVVAFFWSSALSIMNSLDLAHSVKIDLV